MNITLFLLAAALSVNPNGLTISPKNTAAYQPPVISGVLMRTLSATGNCLLSVSADGKTVTLRNKNGALTAQYTYDDNTGQWQLIPSPSH